MFALQLWTVTRLGEGWESQYLIVAAKVDRAGGRWYRPSHSACNAAGCSGDHFGGRILSSRADFDVFVAGGGINGCGIGRDAAGRGFSVSLCDMDDLGSWTSSASTKLIHGGCATWSGTGSAR